MIINLINKFKKSFIMKKIIILFALSSLLFSCGVSKDLARTLRFADTGRTLGVDEIAFKELKTMKKGQSCTWNLLFFIPIFGDGSIITAAEKGDINDVQLIGETGSWYGGILNRTCTVVYGDNPAVSNKNKNSSTKKK